MSKAVSHEMYRRDKAGAQLLSFVQEFAQELCQVASSSLPDSEATLKGLQQALESAKKAYEDSRRVMIEKDVAHSVELGDDNKKIAQRDQALGTLTDELQGLQQAYEGTFGEEELGVVHLQVAPPTQPDQLLQYSSRVLGALGADGYTVPTPKNRGGQFDPLAYVGPLEKARDVLEKSLEQVRQEQQKAAQSLNQRNLATETHDRTFRALAHLLISLCYLAGRDDLRERISTNPRPPAPSRKESPQQEAGEQEPVAG